MPIFPSLFIFCPCFVIFTFRSGHPLISHCSFPNSHSYPNSVSFLVSLVSSLSHIYLFVVPGFSTRRRYIIAITCFPSLLQIPAFHSAFSNFSSVFRFFLLYVVSFPNFFRVTHRFTMAVSLIRACSLVPCRPQFPQLLPLATFTSSSFLCLLDGDILFLVGYERELVFSTCLLCYLYCLSFASVLLELQLQRDLFVLTQESSAARDFGIFYSCWFSQ